MNAMERAGYLAYSKSRKHLARVGRARETIRAGMALCRHPFVAFSAGKDSSAMLWQITRDYPDATALMLTGGETRILYPSLDSILDWWRVAVPTMTLREVLIDHVFAEGWETATWREQWETFVNGWTKYLWSTEAWDGYFLGLREGESNRRRMVLRSQRVAGCSYAIYQYRAGKAPSAHRVCPLDKWSEDDVAAMIVANGIPLLETYEAEGIRARTHYRLGYTSLRMGQLQELRRRDPAGYNRLIVRFPELAEWGG